MKTPLFYKQKPSFGVDIGHGTVKIAQLIGGSESTYLAGYGYESFDPSAISSKGVIVDVEAVAKATYQLIKKHLVGSLVTDSVVATIPSAYTFTRILELPKMEKSELEGAVRLEAEQYIPVPIDDLYIDYEVADRGTESDKNQEVLMVAVPKDIVDSYVEVFSALDVEVRAVEPSLTAITRSVAHAHKIDSTVMIVDLGSRSSDLSIYDGNTIRVAGTTKHGGEDITDVLIKKLGITRRQAYHGKVRYGIKQNTKQGREIFTHSKPMLDDLVTEIKKMERYYGRRNDNTSNLDEIVMMGGGANMPGLDEFLNKHTGLKVTLCDPWANIQMGKLQAPNKIETTLYTTAVGNALVSIQESKVRK